MAGDKMVYTLAEVSTSQGQLPHHRCQDLLSIRFAAQLTWMMKFQLRALRRALLGSGKDSRQGHLRYQNRKPHSRSLNPFTRPTANRIDGSYQLISWKGPSILVRDEQKRELLPIVVEGLFNCIKSSGRTMKHSIKLSMVEICMERVRDLFDLAKDNIQIKESKSQGILLNAVTE